MAHYERRYPGTRWSILYGAYEGIEIYALHELQRMAQRFFPYVIEARPSHQPDAAAEEHLLLVGTASNNRRIQELVDRQQVAPPPRAQGYTLACIPSPWTAERKVIVIAGADPQGVLYGVEHFNAHVLAAQVMPDNPMYLRSSFDQIAPFTITDAPAIENRGIWTWGYVIMTIAVLSITWRGCA